MHRPDKSMNTNHINVCFVPEAHIQIHTKTPAPAGPGLIGVENVTPDNLFTD